MNRHRSLSLAVVAAVTMLAQIVAVTPAAAGPVGGADLIGLQSGESTPTVRVEAETFEPYEGGPIVEGTDPVNVGGIRRNAVLTYRDVDFGDMVVHSVGVEASSDTAGGTAEIHLGGADGPIVAEVGVTPTDSWSDYRVFHAPTEPITGRVTLTVVARAGGDWPFNLDGFTFYGEPTGSLRSVQVPTEAMPWEPVDVVVDPPTATTLTTWTIDGRVVSRSERFTPAFSDAGRTLVVTVTGVGEWGGTVVREVRVADDAEPDFRQTADRSIEAFLSEYRTYQSDIDGHELTADFWKGAEMIEVVLDAYDRTRDQHHLDVAVELLDSFVERQRWLEVDGWWGYNIYNDDIMWIVIASVRLHLYTGDDRYLEMARTNFDRTFERAWSDDLGGGLWWRLDNREKNSCVSGPAAIAAALLYRSTGDGAYLDKAEQTYAWQRDVLVEDTGRVYDRISREGQVVTDATTYNQGTFIGAATLLHEITGDDAYLDDARRVATYTRDVMYEGGVMDDEGGNGDLAGFKGILTRWLHLYGVASGEDQWLDWMALNADRAWSNRNGDDVTWTTWATPTPDDGSVGAWSASASVALHQNLFADSLLLDVVRPYGAFVRAAHLDLLGRLPTADEHRAGRADLLGGLSRRGFLDGLSRHREALTGEVLAGYRDVLGREPEGPGVDYWVDRFAAGLDRTSFYAHLLASPESVRRAGGTDAGFVAAVYRVLLGREVDAAGQDHWVAALESGTPRWIVARAVDGSTESRTIRVVDAYERTLDRAPDLAGLGFWVERLRTISDRDLVLSLMASAEYLRRVEHPDPT